MNVFVGFAPFIVFFVLLRTVSPLAGLVAALIVSLALCVRMAVLGHSIKILEAGSAVLFGLLVLFTLVAAPDWDVATVRLAVDSGLLAIVVFSLVIGRPFTLQYAREQVPEQFWSSPVFHATSRLIALVWAGSFAIHAAADAAAEYVPAIPLSLDVAVSIAALAVAVWFSLWYPGIVRRRRAAMSAAGQAG
jgi:hypothetical protein